MKPISELWSSRAGSIVRAAVVLVLAGLATAKYGKFLDHYYPLKDWLAFRLLLLWGNGALFTAACVSGGHVALKRLFRVEGLPLLETLVLSMSIGVIELTLGMYLGGAAHLFNAVFAYALPVAMIASGAKEGIARAREEIAIWQTPAPRTGSWFDRSVGTLAALAGIFCVIFAYLEIMTPDSINYDSSWCHMTVAESYARHGKIVPFPADWARNVPHLASILYTWAFLVPWQITATKYMGALHMEFFLFCWTLAGVGALANWLSEGKAGRGAWASFFLFPAIFVYDSNMGGAADHILAFFGPPIVLVGLRAARSFDLRLSALFGGLMGGALLTKYQASYIGGAMALVIGWGVLERLVPKLAPPSALDEPAAGPLPWKTILLSVAAMGAGFALVSSPHFLKNAIFYGNPFYPFAQEKIASHPSYPAAPLLFEYVFKDYSWRPHGTLIQNVKDAAKLFFTFSFEPHYSFTKDVPNFGSLFTLSLLFVPFLAGQRRLWLGVLICFGCLMSWGLTFRVDRNLQVMAPLVAATTCAILARTWELGVIARVGLIPLVVLQICWGADTIFYSGHDRLRSSIDLIRAGFDGKRQERFEYRKEFRDVQKVIPKDAVAILHNSHVSLGIDRDLLLDWPGFQSGVTYDEISGPRALFDYWKKLGVSFILHQPDGRTCASKQHDVLFAEYEKRYGNAQHVGAFDVMTLTTPPPPDGASYNVVSIGQRGYVDGIYPLTAMRVHELLPDEFRVYPAPTKPFPNGPDVEASMATVDAAVVYATSPHQASVQAILGRDFLAGATHGAYVVYIRKTPRR